ncbi:rodlin [Streptomyces sp. NPDC006602]|uniref:rodlin n=1 Tax=Streptomyces sp. NPDC006602 TaxID=3364751 RepID=UPI003697609C
MKKLWTTAAVAASVVGVSVMAAPQALATADDGDTLTVSGSDTDQAFGNSTTAGDMSPQLSLVQGSLNKPCVGMPAKVDAGSIVGVVPVALQDIPVLSAPQNQQCAEGSTMVKGDEPLSHSLDDIPVLSANGTNNN